MEEASPTIKIAVFTFLLIMHMIVYAFSAAIQVVSDTVIKEKETKNPTKRSALLLKMNDQPDRFMMTLQFFGTITNLYAGFIMIPLFAKTIDRQVLMFLGLVFVIMLFGILVPQKLAYKHGEMVAYTFVYPVVFLMIISRPITWITCGLSALIAKLFHVKSLDQLTDVTEKEILSMVNEGHEQGVLQASEAQMISNIIDFTDKETKDIMTNRANIIGLDGEMSLQEAVEFMLKEKNSRYPVYLDSIDHIIGIIHIKDAFSALNQGVNGERPLKQLKKLLREVKYTPETRNVDALFRNMQSMKVHMIIVIDEYGQTAGLITMEDILEEIVGSILDEYDDEEIFVEKTGDNRYEVEGLIPLDELGDLLDIDFSNEVFETLNGFIISKLERIPEDDETFVIEYGGYQFDVIAIEHKVIKKVIISKTETTMDLEETPENTL